VRAGYDCGVAELWVKCGYGVWCLRYCYCAHWAVCVGTEFRACPSISSSDHKPIRCAFTIAIPTPAHRSIADAIRHHESNNGDEAGKPRSFSLLFALACLICYTPEPKTTPNHANKTTPNQSPASRLKPPGQQILTRSPPLTRYSSIHPLTHYSFIHPLTHYSFIHPPTHYSFIHPAKAADDAGHEAKPKPPPKWRRKPRYITCISPKIKVHALHVYFTKADAQANAYANSMSRRRPSSSLHSPSQ
jgi:hypothetical protein